FRAATAAYERGDYRAAALAFEEAHRRAPDASALINAGIAWELVGELARAADAFHRAVEASDADPATHADAESRFAVVAKRVGTLDVTSPVGSTVSGGYVENAKIPIKLFLAPGPQQVRVRHPDGTVVTVALTFVQGERRALNVPPPPPL